MDIGALQGKTISELTAVALELKIEGISNLRKQELIFKIVESYDQPMDFLVKFFIAGPGYSSSGSSDCFLVRIEHREQGEKVRNSSPYFEPEQRSYRCSRPAKNEIL